MIADRKGHLPHSKVHRFADRLYPRGDCCVVGRAYLLLIDRENPLSSLSWRR